MEPNENKQLSLQKAISSHEQAAAGLRDLQSGLSQEKYAAMLARVEQNIADLQAEADVSKPEDHV